MPIFVPTFVSEYIEPVQVEEVAHRFNSDYHLIEKICATINSVLSSLEPLPLGHIERSFLTNSEFLAARNATDWMLCNGQSCAGSAYATLTGNATVPNAELYFMRMRDYGVGVNPDGDQSLGTPNADTYIAHGHTASGYSDAMPYILSTPITSSGGGGN